MKSQLLLFGALLFSVCALAQNVSYKTIKDDPEDMHKLFMEVMAISDLGVLINDDVSGGGVGFGYGFRASYFPLVKRIGIQMNYTTSVDLIESFDVKRFEVIGTYALRTKKKKGDHRLILSQSTRGNLTTTESIITPQTRQNNIEIRGGILQNSGAIGFVPLTTGFTAQRKLLLSSSTALVAGIQWRKFHSYVAEIDGAYIAKSSGMFELYGDVILPLSTSYLKRVTLGELEDADPATVQAYEDLNIEAAIGGRVGARYCNSPNKYFTWTGGSELAVFAPNPAYHLFFYMGLSVNIL